MSRQVSRGSAGEDRQMSRQVSRGSAGEDQADEQAGVARLRWRVSCSPLQYSAWRITRTEEPGGLQSMGSQSQTQLSDHHSKHLGI